MEELFVLHTDAYKLIVSSKDPANSRGRLERTLKSRGRGLPQTRVELSPQLKLKYESEPLAFFSLDAPVFFENKRYWFEFVFEERCLSGARTPRIQHKLKEVEEAFEFSQHTKSIRGDVETKNDVGRFSFTLVHEVEGSVAHQSFAFDVLPTKMDLQSDLKVMGQQIDQVLPLWRYSLAERTTHSAGAVKQRGPSFLLLWLAQFESLRIQLESGLKYVINAPHSRLLTTTYSRKLDRLRGRLPARREEAVARAIADKRWHERFPVEKKRLSLDTPENRFVKWVVVSSVEKLSKILAGSNADRLSDSFRGNLEEWRGTLQRMGRAPMFNDVGAFAGLSRESLLLQQGAGYAKIYRSWQQLKWHLALLEGEAELSVRNVAQLYEVWCFLELRRILTDELGCCETKNLLPNLANTDLGVEFKDGMAGAFRFERADGLKVRLAHEPIFKASGNPVGTWTTTQKPDIYLEATMPDGAELAWVFDAKYRIQADDQSGSDGELTEDLVPDDAINQMHRYRDALIHRGELTHGLRQKSRPVFGAYALYPGYFDQHKTANPYNEAIQQTGIGAFSLLPSPDGRGSVWLASFLKTSLGSSREAPSSFVTDAQFLQEAPRIGSRGMDVSYVRDLVITMSQIGNDRSAEYIEKFRSGEARHYHTKQLAFERQGMERHIINEARYLAVALDCEGAAGREIRWVYPIKKAERVARGDLTDVMTGRVGCDDPEELYWLFYLGNALQLREACYQPVEEHFRVRLVDLSTLNSGGDAGKLSERYQGFA